MRLYLDLADTVVSLSIAHGVYEPEEWAFLRGVVRPGDVVLDVGANLGYLTVLMASLVGPTGRVYAFEPLPENADLLARSIAENRFDEHVTLTRAAVSDAAGEAELVIGRHHMNSGGGFLYQPGAERPPGVESANGRLVRLDELELRRPISVLKIDVEGAEMLALRGARELLREDRPIVLSEINARQLGLVSGTTAAEFIAEVESLGYECRLLEDGALVRDEGDPERGGTRTVVFVPPESSPLRARLG